jgi:hypothetical protein
LSDDGSNSASSDSENTSFYACISSQIHKAKL